MREKLIDIIECYADFLDWDWKEDMVDSIMEKCFATDNNVGGEWIPVSERLPKENADVLCCRGNHIGAMMDVYTYKGDDKWEDTYGYWQYGDLEGITHWMPLPEPPKEE